MEKQSSLREWCLGSVRWFEKGKNYYLLSNLVTWVQSTRLMAERENHPQNVVGHQLMWPVKCEFTFTPMHTYAHIQKSNLNWRVLEENGGCENAATWYAMVGSSMWLCFLKLSCPLFSYLIPCSSRWMSALQGYRAHINYEPWSWSWSSVSKSGNLRTNGHRGDQFVLCLCLDPGGPRHNSQRPPTPGSLQYHWVLQPD